MIGGHLRIVPRPASGPNMPVDHFMRSLALNQRNKAIGVILSGGGTDGTRRPAVGTVARSGDRPTTVRASRLNGVLHGIMSYAPPSVSYNV